MYGSLYVPASPMHLAELQVYLSLASYKDAPVLLKETQYELIEALLMGALSSKLLHIFHQMSQQH